MWLRLELIDLTMVSVGGRVKWSWAEVVPNLFFPIKRRRCSGFSPARFVSFSFSASKQRKRGI